MQIVVLMAIHGDISRPASMRRSIDLADAAPLGQVLRRDVAPVLAAVARELDKPSSVPTQIKPFTSGDSATAKIVS